MPLTIRDAREAAFCLWKYILSFRKRDWNLGDYPVRVRKNQLLYLGERFKDARWEPYLAQVINWWTLSGGGDSPGQARAALADAFNTCKVERLQRGIALPRPGTSVPIEFATSRRVNSHPELMQDFLQRIIGLEWAWISDESSLWDFHSEPTNDAMVRKISDIYGVDVSDIKSGNIAEILERIAVSRYE